MDKLKNLWRWYTRYLVVVAWEGREIIHWARTAEECLEWVRCYPAAAIVIYGKHGRMIGARW